MAVDPRALVEVELMMSVALAVLLLLLPACGTIGRGCESIFWGNGLKGRLEPDAVLGMELIPRPPNPKRSRRVRVGKAEAEKGAAGMPVNS